MTTTNTDPSPRQREVLAFMAKRERAGDSASTREIVAMLGARASNSAMCHLQALERKGLITPCDHHKARSRRVTPSGWAALDEVGGGTFDTLVDALSEAAGLSTDAPRSERVKILRGMVARSGSPTSTTSQVG